MAYTALSFVADELLTSTKMNLMAANDAALRDGTGIQVSAIKPSHIDTSVRPKLDVTFGGQTGRTTYSGTTGTLLYTPQIIANNSTVPLTIEIKMQLMFHVSSGNGNVQVGIAVDGVTSGSSAYWDMTNWTSQVLIARRTIQPGQQISVQPRVLTSAGVTIEIADSNNDTSAWRPHLYASVID